MSLVGTRPPTVDEWEKYELHHRSRMSTKPGITGMWQVSGRSDITDLTLLMEQSWHPESVRVSRKRMELSSIKAFLDENYTEKIVLDDLAEKFFINKFYMSKIFKETYGVTINNYMIERRITRAKQLLRFTDKTIDEIGVMVGMDSANYFSRVFRKGSF